MTVNGSTGHTPRWIGVVAVALLTVGVSLSALAQCGAAPVRIPAGGGNVELTPTPWPIAVGKHFSVRVHWCGEGPPPSDLRLDADMPAHRHGMNYRPTVSKADRAGLEWQADGLMFHMPGRWRFIVELAQGGSTRRVSGELDVR